MNKIINYIISGISVIGIFIVATLLHKSNVVSGGVMGDTTQVQILNMSTGLVYYIISLILMFVSTIFGRKTLGEPLTALVSLGIFIVRFIACLAMVSGGTSIFVFEGKFMQIIQLVMILLCIPAQFMTPAKGTKKNN